jgi:nanoRNase/pAp phosphatase (c-di-AMP/oligoRNAs hydrolase)
VHDYPDPDALASALLLSHLARERYKLRTRIAYGGHINRAENRAMVQQLRITLTPADRIHWGRYKCVAMVDTQPAFGNHSLPGDVKPRVVIDHHPKVGSGNAEFEDIRTDYGACATMLVEYLQAAELEISVDLATAITYAIRSETQELGRDTSPLDIEAYLQFYPRANKRKLARIFTPKLPKTYFLLLGRALKNAKVFRNIAHTHLQEVESPDFVAQIADLLLRHERITWVLVTGRFDSHLFVSMRCSHANANAGRMLKQIIGRSGSAGGHAMVAGGQIPIEPGRNNRWEDVENKITGRFLEKLKHNKEGDWKPMLTIPSSSP